MDIAATNAECTEVDNRTHISDKKHFAVKAVEMFMWRKPKQHAPKTRSNEVLQKNEKLHRAVRLRQRGAQENQL